MTFKEIKTPEQLMKYLDQNFKYGVIDKKGNVVRPEVLVSLSPECDREALRIVRSMPRWEPGMIDRCKPYVNLTEPDTAAKEPAHCYYMIPVYFPPSDN